MPKIPRIVLPHGGYRALIAYRKSDVIYEGTVVFCRRFLSAHGNRTVDQMVQAARSCKQNIAEGSAASGTSKETEIMLTNVARASLDELIEDYTDWLKSHDAVIWSISDERARSARSFAKNNSDWEAWKPIFETRASDVLANLQLTLCHQTSYLLERMITRQEEDYKEFGSIRERLNTVRATIYAEEWGKKLYSWLDCAKTPQELEARATEIESAVARMVTSVKRQKKWP